MSRWIAHVKPEFIQTLMLKRVRSSKCYVKPRYKPRVETNGAVNILVETEIDGATSELANPESPWIRSVPFSAMGLLEDTMVGLRQLGFERVFVISLSFESCCVFCFLMQDVKTSKITSQRPGIRQNVY